MTEHIKEKSFTNNPIDREEECSVSPDIAEIEVEELVDLLHLIDSLPMEFRPKVYKALERIVDGFERRQRILACIQESLGQMNLDLKYLIFDLEATRRERNDYRRLYEETLF